MDAGAVALFRPGALSHLRRSGAAYDDGTNSGSSSGVTDAMRQSLTVRPILVANQVTVLDLRSLMHERFNRHRDAVGVILERCYARIRRCAGVHLTECTFDVPRFVPGLPLFDQGTCADAVVAHLARNGFSVTRSGVDGDPTLAISWSLTPTPVTRADADASAAWAATQRQHHSPPSSTQDRPARPITDFRPRRFMMER
jgi:hypothetical protein